MLQEKRPWLDVVYLPDNHFFKKINPILLGSSSLSFEIHLEDMQAKG